MTQDQKEAALNCVYAYETSDVYKALQDALTELEAHKAIAASFVKAEQESVAFRTKEELANVLVPWYEREDSTNVLAEQPEQEPNTITFRNDVQNTWVMRITADQRIEVNEGIEVTEAAKLVLTALEPMLRYAAPVRTKDLTDAVDAAMVEMQNIHPPLRRSECERLIRAANYTAQVRTKDLTDDEIDAIEIITDRQFARAVIAADREKNK